MDKLIPVGRGLPPPSNNKDCDPSDSLTGVRQSAVPQPFILTTSSYNIYILLIFATTYLNVISAQGNFTMNGTSYNCPSNIICLGEAHGYRADFGNGIEVGLLSLLRESGDGLGEAGIAYYRQPVKMLDLSTRQSAVFNTSFTIVTVLGSSRGDGMTFVMSANNSCIGGWGGNLGIFNPNGTTIVKSIVVEFDTFQNVGSPTFDISDNHVSLDFTSITYKAAANASDVNIDLGDQLRRYAWVEYNNETQQIEVRISNKNSRPINPLLKYKVNLFDVVEEYMWMGFSSSAGGGKTNFYIMDWTFETNEILAPIPVPSPVQTPSSLHPARGKSGGHKLDLIVGISLGTFVLCLTCIVITLFVQRRSGERGSYWYWQLGWIRFIREDPMMQIEGTPQRFNYKQLSLATKTFSKESKLGQGGFGNVYRGVLPSSSIPVAVKKINGDSTQGEKEFMAEVCIISQLRHRNLIQLLGWCKDASKGKYLLVYELMPNGSLDKVLFQTPESQTAPLSWKHRFNTVTGIAAALDYLHQGWKQQVIHRDIKSSNIMLDKEWNAKLGDFGLARLVDHQNEAATTDVAGTRGYLAPEMVASGRFTDKTDVFAFGAVVLELACGRRALSPHLPEDEMVLVDWVWQRLSEGDLMSTVDERLKDYDTYWIQVMLKVGLLCSHPNPSSRPTMRHVVQILAGDSPVPSIPVSKPVLVYVELDQCIPNTELDSQEIGNNSRSRSRSGLSGSMSLVSMNFPDSTGVPTMKFCISSNSIASLRDHICSSDGLEIGSP